MAPKLKTLAQVFPIAKVAWFQRLNEARATGNYGTQDALNKIKDSLTLHGWLLDPDGVIIAEPIRPELKAEALSARQEQWTKLQQGALTNGEEAIKLKVFEILYTDKGKLVEPEYTGISGNRRDSVFFPAMVERFKQKMPLSTEIGAMVTTFSNPLERLRAQVMENEMKTQGFQDMSNADRLIAARRSLQLGGTESSLGTMFSRGTSQKLWGIVRLDALWPNVKIVDRMCLPADHEEFIGWGVDKEALRNLADRSQPDSLREYNFKRTAAGDTTVPAATEEEVKAYFANPKIGKNNLPKIMDRKDIDNLARQNPVKLVQKAMKAVLERNTDHLSSCLKASAGFNALDDLVETGDYPRVELVLAKLVTTKQRDSLLQELVAVCEKY